MNKLIKKLARWSFGVFLFYGLTTYASAQLITKTESESTGSLGNPVTYVIKITNNSTPSPTCTPETFDESGDVSGQFPVDWTLANGQIYSPTPSGVCDPSNFGVTNIAGGIAGDTSNVFEISANDVGWRACFAYWNCPGMVVNGTICADEYLVSGGGITGGRAELLWRNSGGAADYQISIGPITNGNDQAELQIATDNGAVYNVIAPTSIPASNNSWFQYNTWYHVCMTVNGYTITGTVYSETMTSGGPVIGAQLDTITATDSNEAFAAGYAGLQSSYGSSRTYFDNISLTTSPINYLNTTVTDTLPAGLSYVSCSGPSSVTCGNAAGNVINWNTGEVDQGDSQSLTLVANVLTCPLTAINTAFWNIDLPAATAISNAVTLTVGCNSPTPTNTSTSTDTLTPTYTATNTATATLTNTDTNTFTSTLTNTATNTATATVTNTSTATRTNTNTNTATSTLTNTDTNTFTSTLTNTATNTATATVTNTFTATQTNTDTNTLTPTQTNTATNTLIFTATDTNTPTLTSTNTQINTATNTPTATLSNTMTNTFTDTQTATLTDTDTFTVTMTNTPTDTFIFSATPTSSSTSTDTQTITATNTVTDTITNTVTTTSTNTITNTFTNTLTDTPTALNTPTNTMTSSVTSTLTNTVTSTMTQGNTSTNTQTNTPTLTSTSTATLTPTPTPASLVTMAKQVSAATAQAGDTLTYSIGITVTGNNASNVMVTDLLPQGLTFVGYGTTAPAGTLESQSPPALKWILPSPLAIGTYQLTYQAQVASFVAGGAVTNNAQLTDALLQTPITSSVSVQVLGKYTVSVNIYNSAGEVIKTILVKQYSQPINSISLESSNVISTLQGLGSEIEIYYNGNLIGTWDGSDNSGNPVSNGNYEIRVGNVWPTGMVTSVSQEATVNRKLSSVTANIYNSAGELIRTLYNVVDDANGSQMTNVSLSEPVMNRNLATSGNGSNLQIFITTSGAPLTLTWDGTNNMQTNVSPGTYEIELHWDNGEGETANITRTVLITAGGGASGTVIAQPNFLTPSQTMTTTFNAIGVTNGSSINVNIYTIAGELVKSISNGSGVTATWTVTGMASGIYIAVVDVKDMDGGMIAQQSLKILVLH